MPSRLAVLDRLIGWNGMWGRRRDPLAIYPLPRVAGGASRRIQSAAAALQRRPPHRSRRWTCPAEKDLPVPVW
jgi:hypothetical protein